MAFPTTSLKHLQPPCMGVQYHTSPQECTSLSTHENPLDGQCYTSPQASLSTNNNLLEYYISSGLLQDYEQMPIEGYSTLAEGIAHNQLMISNNIERSNIDWLNQASNYDYKDAQEPLINSSSTISSTNQASNYEYKDAKEPFINSSSTICSTNQASNYEYKDAQEPLINLSSTKFSTNQASNYHYKDAQEPLINSCSTISSTNLSPKPHINQLSDYNFGKQALANYIDDAPPLILLSNAKPLGIEPKALDLQVIEQELAMYHNVGASINEEVPYNLKCLAQGDQILNASSLNLLCDGAPSLIKQIGIAEESNIINAPSSLCRSTITTTSCIAHNFLSHLVPNEERGNAVVKREEREYGDGYSTMMLNSNTPIHFGGVRREIEKKSCREEGAEEREASGVGKRKNKYNIGDERETRRERNYVTGEERETKSYIGDEREESGESMRRYNGSLLEVKRENVGRKRGRETYLCKRRAGGGGHSEEEQEVILVRARRGQATDSHSLAERVRREKISQRMKLLQDLVPSCTKVLGKAAVLEEIINYVKSLQQQIEFLSMRLATTDYQKRFQI